MLWLIKVGTNNFGASTHKWSSKGKYLNDCKGGAIKNSSNVPKRWLSR